MIIIRFLTSSVGAFVGAGVGLFVGFFVGAGVGGFEGAGVGCLPKAVNHISIELAKLKSVK